MSDGIPHALSNTKGRPRVYISGKISNLDTSIVWDTFKKAENYIQYKGWIPVSPLMLEHNHDKSWGSYMIEGLETLRTCNAIYILKNSEDSIGVQIEILFARKLGISLMWEI